MWEELKAISHQCILGDFNVLLYKEDRRGGNDIQDTEIREMAEFIKYELRWNGAYYSWTNKTVWSRIDRTLVNIHCYEISDFTQNHYLANVLSDHSPMLIQLPPSAKPKKKFLFCEMWCKHPDFTKLVDSVIPPNTNNPLNQLRTAMNKLKPLLELARGELTKIQQLLQEDPLNSRTIQAGKEARSRYITILSSSMALMKQQCKIEWISYGDDNTRTFFAKAKQRKLASYIYQIKDEKGNLVEGFDKVEQTMMSYYNALLGEQFITR
ncbi:hypothetical protein Cgig2_032285 [Carnegiea gigantea]|uniref:Endonuclease/exonuclease/phosphatase domain-containing protein n=1 Tax=Carnegiea gigantea TaxID=171969 RepID=A0A9Q1JEQ8_9CARY|nr:hypothetical protein Cgig2_032285 [Carnegiea gigantea]